MVQTILIGNFSAGLIQNRIPVNIDNDAFAFLYNFYVWRGRVRRKRGTATLARLSVQFSETLTASITGAAFGGNLITQFTLGSSSSIVPGTVILTAGSYTFQDINSDGNLIATSGSAWYEPILGITQATNAVVSVASSLFAPGNIVYIQNVSGMTQINNAYYTVVSATPFLVTLNVDSTTFTPYISGGTIQLVAGSINYATGAISLTLNASFNGLPLTIKFSDYPGLPVMGLVDYDLDNSEVVAPTTSSLYPVLLAFDTEYSYQINQAVVPPTFYNTTYYKTTGNPFFWSGTDFQLFYTTNYSGCLWATNFKPGFNFLIPSVIVAGATTSFFTALPNPLITNDWVWFNEIDGTLGDAINGQAFQVTVISNVNFTIPFNSTGLTAGAPGIFQLLTNTIPGQDGIKWYDGDPTATTGLPAATGLGWVNFAPPLTGSAGVSIDNKPSRIYYLVGALAILSFKDRLLFFSPYIQASTGPPIPLRDTILWSWNGTPFYAALIPANQTYNVKAYYVDQTGLGGYLPAGISQPIKTISNNEDALLIGFGGDGRKTRFTYTGNDLQPFLFFNINSELPSSSTYSAITLDKGALDIGQYGLAMTDQQSSQRVDLFIPDEIFEIQASNNGADRVNALRDFYRQWIYFSYPTNTSKWKFPTQTLLFNYTDNTWAIFYENWTVHGYYRPQFKITWQTLPYESWETWNVPWNTPLDSPLYPKCIAGNPQGFVLSLDEGTSEGPSGAIQAIAISGGVTQITSTNHCVNIGDYLLINNAIGVTPFNGLIGKVVSAPSANMFVIDILFPSGTYIGAGTYTRLSQPLLQTKQFPSYWNIERQTRIGPQKYLFDRTSNGQVTLNIYLSQDNTNSWNNPIINVAPNSLEYSQIIHTCPESTNLGLTPANINLQTPLAFTQQRIWHRNNTSLIGDTVQLGITLSDAQMRNLEYATSEITLHAISIPVSPAGLIA